MEDPEDPDECAVEERAGKKRGDDRRGLAVRVRKPGVERREAHLRSIAHQEKEERSFQPGHVKLRGVLTESADAQRSARPRSAGRCDREEKVAEQGEPDPHRADEKVLPCGLERAVVPVKIDERGAGECRGFHRDPEQPQILTQDDEGHRGQKEEKAPDEDRFRGVREAEAFQEIRARTGRLAPEVSHGVDRSRQEEAAQDH